MNNTEQVPQRAKDVCQTQPKRPLFLIQENCTISVALFCQMSGMGKTTTYELIKKGSLKSTKVGRRRLISLESASALINPGINVGEA